MVPLSIMGMTGWVNPSWLTVRRPWTLFVIWRRSAGAFFVRTPAWVPEGCTRTVRHATSRLSERAAEVISIPLAPVLFLGAGSAGWTVASTAAQRGACGIPGSWSSQGPTTRLVRPVSSWQAFLFKDRYIAAPAVALLRHAQGIRHTAAGRLCPRHHALHDLAARRSRRLLALDRAGHEALPSRMRLPLGRHQGCILGQPRLRQGQLQLLGAARLVRILAQRAGLPGCGLGTRAPGLHKAPCGRTSAGQDGRYLHRSHKSTVGSDCLYGGNARVRRFICQK